MTIQSLVAYPLPTAEELPIGRVNWPFEPGRAAFCWSTICSTISSISTGRAIR